MHSAHSTQHDTTTTLINRHRPQATGFIEQDATNWRGGFSYQGTFSANRQVHFARGGQPSASETPWPIIVTPCFKTSTYITSKFKYSIYFADKNRGWYVQKH